MCSSDFHNFSAHILNRKYEDPKLHPYRIMGDSKLCAEYDLDEPSNKISNILVRI
jgi:hypothetical protein